MVRSKIMKVLSREGMPKHEDMWMREVTYYPEEVSEGRSARLFYNGFNRVVLTSPVEFIKEDENNIVLTTLNSIYHIKKFRGVMAWWNGCFFYWCLLLYFLLCGQFCMWDLERILQKNKKEIIKTYRSTYGRVDWNSWNKNK